MTLTFGPLTLNVSSAGDDVSIPCSNFYRNQKLSVGMAVAGIRLFQYVKFVGRPPSRSWPEVRFAKFQHSLTAFRLFPFPSLHLFLPYPVLPALSYRLNPARKTGIAIGCLQWQGRTPAEKYFLIHFPLKIAPIVTVVLKRLKKNNVI